MKKARIYKYNYYCWKWSCPICKLIWTVRYATVYPVHPQLRAFRAAYFHMGQHKRNGEDQE